MSDFGLLFVVGCLVVLVIGQRRRSRAMRAHLDEALGIIERNRGEIQLAVEIARSWERKYNRVLSARVLGAIRANEATLEERFNSSPLN